VKGGRQPLQDRHRDRTGTLVLAQPGHRDDLTVFEARADRGQAEPVRAVRVGVLTVSVDAVGGGQVVGSDSHLGVGEVHRREGGTGERLSVRPRRQWLRAGALGTSRQHQIGRPTENVARRLVYRGLAAATLPVEGHPRHAHPQTGPQRGHPGDVAAGAAGVADHHVVDRGLR
jgi:hypothetical protein